MTGRHPLPWHMPGREDWVHLEPHLDYGDDELVRPFKLVLGRHDSMAATLTRDQLRALRDVCDAALTAPFTVLVLGGDRAADWMWEPMKRHLEDARRHNEAMVIRHAGRPGSIDITVSVWAQAHRVPERVGPVDVADGGNACLIFCTGDGDRNLELVGAAHQARIPAWWCRQPASTEQTEAAR